MAVNLKNYVRAQTVEFYEPPKTLQIEEQAKSSFISPAVGRVVDIPFVRATVETLQGFGRIVSDFDSTEVKIEKWPQKGRGVKKGNLGGVTEGTFRCFWEGEFCLVENESVCGHYIVGSRNGDDILVTYANYHPDGSQIFYNTAQTPFIIVLAKPCPDHLIKPSDFVAFYCTGKEGIEINTGTWHQANFPANPEEILHLRNKQGKVHGVVEVVFDKEFDISLRVRDALRCVPEADLDLIPKSPSLTSVDTPHVPEEKKRTESNNEQIKLLNLTVTQASKEALVGIGALISDFEAASVDILPWPRKERPMLYGNEAGITELTLAIEWKDGKLVEQGTENVTGVEKMQGDKQKMVFKKVFLHPDGSKVVFPSCGGSFYILVANTEGEDDVQPQDLTLYNVASGNGLHIRANVWHSFPVPADDIESALFKVKHSAICASVELDLEEEFNTLIVG